MYKAIIIIGCGAQTKYVMEILSKTGGGVSRILDPVGGKVGTRIGGFPIKAYHESDFFGAWEEEGTNQVVICLSDNRFKRELFNRLQEKAKFVNVIHPDSTIASSTELGRCIIVNAGAIIQPYAMVGNGCMIHAGVVIEHDNIIEDFVNIAPGVTLAGGVRVGEGTTVFSGSIVVPNVQIGKYAVVGAGSLVLHDVPDGVLVYGNPARVIRELSS